MAKKRVRDITKDPRYLTFCETYYDNLVAYILDHSRYTPTWQQLEVIEAIQEPGCRVAIASGHGCFGAGTRVKMFDGSLKNVEAVKEGDLVMGHDGTKRTVHSLCQGRESLYKCEFKDGNHHVYNDQHRLYLNKDGENDLIAVQHFVFLPRDEQAKYSAVRKDGSLYNIKRVFPYKVDDYYGFELVENNLFLLEDDTIVSNTGKSWIFAWVLDWHLRVFPFSNAMLTATNIDQARAVVWKYLDEVIQDMDKAVPWQKGFFIKQAKSYYARYYKDSWYVIPKTASKDKPENLAGQHNINYLVMVDEASGVPDANIGVLKGALTHDRNRFVMASQPTRPVGHFAEALTKLSKKDNSKDGIYDAFFLNAEESRIVKKSFIREKLIEYGGHHSPEYQIKVLGRLPDNLAGYLIPAKWCEECQHYEIIHEEEWGWVLTADVGEGIHRDSSVINISRVSGYNKQRKVENVVLEEYLGVNEKEFAHIIASKYHSGDYPYLTIGVDADGAGRTTILELEDMGIPVTRIHWGLPVFTEADKIRYTNQRAYSHLQLRYAIFEERFKGPYDRKFVDQASKLPYRIDEKGRYAIMTKEKMRSEGIKSPDISDTCCFIFLVDYIPCSNVEDSYSIEEDDYIKLAKIRMEEAMGKREGV